VLSRFLPFVEWFRDYSWTKLRTDLFAGLTVALVLIPQSMAYAQLAGLPAYYGLYAAFLPPLIASLFGSSRQLATGPVAVVSLMTCAALEPLAVRGGESFVSYAILMSLIVGGFQLALGLLRLGSIVNFISHPVVNGFINGAAIIIATSQLAKFFNVYVDPAEYHFETIYRIIKAAFHYTHWPTFALAMTALGIMYALKRINPRIPYVLVAVVITSCVAWMTGFEHNEKISIDAIRSEAVRSRIIAFNAAVTKIDRISEERTRLSNRLFKIRETQGKHSAASLEIRLQLEVITIQLKDLNKQSYHLREKLGSLHFHGVREKSGRMTMYMVGNVPHEASQDGRIWRIRAGHRAIDAANITFIGGGELVGNIPHGLPRFILPGIDLEIMLKLLPMAIIICLLGFMEAISIAKVMAARTGQRLDPNQELIGQGLSNVIGSCTQSYPVSGSFSRSAVNLHAGACTGMSTVFACAMVVMTLQFLTPLLYYIPQSVLASIIMMAVISLINAKGFVHAWKAQRYDGVFSIITFICTLIFAPHLDWGIIIGVALSLGYYVFRSTKPAVAVLSLHPDGSMRDAKRWGLKQCRYIAVIRFNGPLYFANTSYLEDQISERVKNMPELKHVLITAKGINEIDATGEELFSLLVDRLRSGGYMFSICSLTDHVIDVMKRTHLYEKIGPDNIFPTTASALLSIHAKAHSHSDEKECPLLTVCHIDTAAAVKKQGGP
jgi:SulP family sulfate permease